MRSSGKASEYSTEKHEQIRVAENEFLVIRNGKVVFGIKSRTRREGEKILRAYLERGWR